MFWRDMFLLFARSLVEQAVVVIRNPITATHLVSQAVYLSSYEYIFIHLYKDHMLPDSNAEDRMRCKYTGRGREEWRDRCVQGDRSPVGHILMILELYLYQIYIYI